MPLSKVFIVAITANVSLDMTAEAVVATLLCNSLFDDPGVPGKPGEK